MRAFEDDLELVRQAAHQPDAFAEIYRRHVSSVYRYLMARTGDEQVAQDLTAETFLAALRHIGRYRGQGTLIAWLLSIAHNAAASYFRQDRSLVSLEEVEEMPDPDASLDDVICRRLDQAQALRALQQLSVERAEVLVLRVVLELSVEETSHVMRKSEAAVKMLARRALADLRRCLVALVEEESVP